MHTLKCCQSGSIDLIDCLRIREEEACDTGENCIDVGTHRGKLLLNIQTNQIESVVPAICLQKYVLLTKNGEGTFSEVIQARCRQTSTFVAVKCMKGRFQSIVQGVSPQCGVRCISLRIWKLPEYLLEASIDRIRRHSLNGCDLGTRYRAPECLLTDGYYTYKMDMWGVVCVLFEIVSLYPLFPGNNELDQIQKIHQILGTPQQAVLDKMRKRSGHANFDFPSFDGTGIASLIPHASVACVELVNKLLAYDPAERLSARQAHAHTYFQDFRGKEQLPEAFHASCPTQSPIVWDSLMSPRPSKLFSFCRDCFDDVIPM